MILPRILALIVLAFTCSCNYSLVTQDEPSEQPGMFAGLPDLGMLDNIKSATLVRNTDVPVLAPIDQTHTAEYAGTLQFTSPSASLAWAIYRLGPIEGDYMTAIATGSPSLWLLAADYGVGHWSLATQLASGSATLDMTLLADLLSPMGYAYLAVVCPQNQYGVLTKLDFAYNTIVPPLELTIDVESLPGISVSWPDGGFSYYELYRTTVPDDPAPYLIATRPAPGGVGPVNVLDWVPDSGGLWLPDERDNETPLDPLDDFPAAAPGIVYYYKVLAFNASGILQSESNWTPTHYPWGNRRATRRVLPDTTATTRVFADQLLPNQMTDDQVQWCVENLVGTQKIFGSQADDFRQYNHDFMVLGYHLGLGAGPIGNVHGDDWDADADWPYVDRHENWFIHMPTSTQPHGRVLQQDWNWYGADPDNGWHEYLGANLLQMLGEDHFDGWFVDYSAELWNTDPYPWWPDGETMFGFWTPKTHACFKHVTELAKAHPLQPYIIPNAAAMVTTVSDLKYYGDDWACDGIMVEGHCRWSSDSYFTEEDWTLEHNRILEHQTAGLIAILQTHIFTPDINDRLFVYGSYLLVRGEHTYINWLGDDGLDTVWSDIGQWYPEWDWSGGTPVFGQPLQMEDMQRGFAQDGTYQRDFSDGFVVVNPTERPSMPVTISWDVSRMIPSGGGNVDETGNPIGSLSWEPVGKSYIVPAHSAGIFRYND